MSNVRIRIKHLMIRVIDNYTIKAMVKYLSNVEKYFVEYIIKINVFYRCLDEFKIIVLPVEKLDVFRKIMRKINNNEVLTERDVNNINDILCLSYPKLEYEFRRVY